MSVSPGWGDTHRPPRGAAGAPVGVSLPTEPPSRSAALSALQTFKDMGVSVTGVSRPRNPGCVPPGDTRVPTQVLEELRGPAGPQLQLTQPFRSTAARAELETFVRQFLQM